MSTVKIPSSEPMSIDIERQFLGDIIIALYEGDSSVFLSRQITLQVSPTEQRNLRIESIPLDLVVRSFARFRSMGVLSSATSARGIDIYGTLRQTVIEHFKAISEVQSIYQDITDDNLTFWVFTDEQQYDDELMDRLIAQEQEILDLYPRTPIMLEYVPSVLCPNPEDVISSTAKKIYQV